MEIMNIKSMQPGERLGVRGKGRVQALFFLGKLGVFRWSFILNSVAMAILTKKDA
jgi:hypothetical protein